MNIPTVLLLALLSTSNSPGSEGNYLGDYSKHIIVAEIEGAVSHLRISKDDTTQWIVQYVSANGENIPVRVLDESEVATRSITLEFASVVTCTRMEITVLGRWEPCTWTVEYGDAYGNFRKTNISSGGEIR